MTQIKYLIFAANFTFLKTCSCDEQILYNFYPLIFYLLSPSQIERFNALLRIIKSSLIDLEKGIKGLVVMSSDLEETFNCIFDAKVPPLWGKVRDVEQPKICTVIMIIANVLGIQTFARNYWGLVATVT